MHQADGGGEWASGIGANYHAYSGAVPLEDGDLLLKGKNFKGGGASTAEEHADHSDDGEDELRHELPL